MKILHIISQAPDFTGSGKFIQEIIRHSNNHGHDNFLVAGVQADFEMPGSLLEKENCIFVRFDGKDLVFPIAGMSDIMPYQSSVFSKLNREDIQAYKKAFTIKIQHAIEQFKPDILHTHHLWIVSSVARKIAPGIPMVTTCHGTCLRQHYLCPGLGKSMTETLQEIDQVIALSCDQKENIVNTLGIDPLKIDVVSGGYNKDFFFYRPKVFNGVVELVYAGKISTPKGVPWLLKSLRHIKEMPFRLHMAGSSSDSETQKCLGLAEDLKGKVIYHGPLSHEKLGSVMRQSHVFVLPSFFEGLPLVLMEALACGCRIMATDLPGVKEIFGTESTLMVKMIPLPELETIDSPYKKDEKQLELILAEALKQQITAVQKSVEPDEDYIRSMASEFTWEKIFSKIETIYLKAAKNF